jgi:hypothetical protein
MCLRAAAFTAFWAIVATAGVTAPARVAAVDPPDTPLVAAIRKLDLRVITDESAAAEARRSARRDAFERIKQANRANSSAWYAIKTRDAWEQFRDDKLERLRESLTQGEFPTEPKNIVTHRTIEGDGFAIENITFESRPGIVVTANLYRPSQPPAAKMPGILIVHSHHAPKTQGELQVMGMTFARQGATVLVMDQLGHGERRTHAFGVDGKYPGPYKPSRQDYYFRYNTGVQLALAGESLMGYMVGDLMCGATLVAGRPGVDPAKLILMGAVAGGGDPAGVAGALDKRFAAVVPFNFGGYEPEDQFPLPDDAEQTFNYSGSGSWESTRNLRLSARDGFAPWMIVGATAPRALVYAHEFRWDEPRDPMWRRLRTIYGFYGAADRLSSAFGSGTVRGKTVEDTHCTNIGAVHRKQLYPDFQRWFGLPVPVSEQTGTRPSEDLLSSVEVPPLHKHVRALVDERLAAARAARKKFAFGPYRDALQEELRPLLGTIEPGDFREVACRRETVDEITVERVLLEIPEPGATIPIPLVLLQSATAKPPADGYGPRIIVALAQRGKQAWTTRRPEQIAAWLEAGIVVAIPDLRGTGETSDGDGRGRSSGATSLSSTEQMLGQTVVGRHVRDVRTVTKYLRGRPSFATSIITLFGDGLVPANAADLAAAAPLDAEKLPAASEPQGALVSLLVGLYDDSIALVFAGGALPTFTSILDEPYFYYPHDGVVPGMAARVDIADLLVAQSAEVYLFDCRDGANRRISAARRDELSATVRSLFREYAVRFGVIENDLEPAEVARRTLAARNESIPKNPASGLAPLR